MGQSLFGVFLIVLVVSGIVLGVFGVAAHLYGVSEMTWGTFGGRLQTYADFNLGLSMRYPADFVVNKEYFYDGMGANKYIQGVSFAVPNEKLEGTNLLPGTQASIEIIPNMPNCTVRLFMSDPDRVTAVEEDGVLFSTAYKKSSNKKNEYEEHVYAVMDSSPCVAVRYLIHTEPITSYTSPDRAQYSREDLFSAFNTMRDSLVVQRPHVEP
jgi:hypothetical protein